MRRFLPLVLIFGLVVEATTAAAVRGKEAKYIGGTVTALPENTEGKIELAQSAAEFTAKGDAKLIIPYDKIDSLEYGQKAGRRLGLSLAVSPLFLLSKKRRHFLTLNFVDETGKKQGAVFELSKGIVHETLSMLETKTGKKVEYESDEARKHAETR